MRTLVSIFAGIFTHIALFIYLSARTTCAVTVRVERAPQVGDCLMTFWDNMRISYPGALFMTDVQEGIAPPGGLPVTDAWRQALTPPFLVPAVAGLLVGLLLWALWARKHS